MSDEQQKVKATSDIKYIVIDGVMELEIDRPKKKNALSQAMYVGLTEAIKKAGEDSSIKVVLLFGADHNLCSGNDLADFAGGAGFGTSDSPILNFLRAFSSCSKPIVVAVEGVAVGIGTTLLTHSDLIYASSNARFKLPFVSLGLCPEFASSMILPKLVGHAKAAEWLLLGSEFSPQEALETGLINAVVDEPIVKAREVAQQLARQAPKAVQTTKALMKRAIVNDIDEAIEAEIVEFEAALKGEEFKEAVTAFFEKRSPDFSKCS